MTDLTATPCYTCKRSIWMTELERATLRENGATFHCMWGHLNHYPAGKTRDQILREERDEAIRQRNLETQRAARLREERDAANRSLVAQRAATTRLRNRVKNGLCPCCNRSFVQLARHMATQHPTFKAQAEEAA